MLFLRQEKRELTLDENALEVKGVFSAGLTRLELAAFCLTSRRSNRLSYNPMHQIQIYNYQFTIYNEMIPQSYGNLQRDDEPGNCGIAS